jgi:acetyl esterase/lipase
MEKLPDTYLFLDPEIAVGLQGLPDFVFTPESLSTIRDLVPGAADASPDIERSDRPIGEDGVAVTVHRALGCDRPAPGVYWIHGGGLIMGNRHMDNVQLERWCRSLGCVCVSVEYRLAPEYPFPTPLEDCYSGLAWLANHADELGIDPARVGIGGRSAGGGLAAAVAMLARDRGGPDLRFQILDCPMLDDRVRWPSRHTPGLPIWNRDSNELGWRSYLGDLWGAEEVSSLAAPARAVDLTGLPPAFVAVGTADGFRDEAIDYAARLNQAGVTTELHVYPGVPHGVLLFANAAVTQRTIRDLDDFVGRSVTPGALAALPSGQP